MSNPTYILRFFFELGGGCLWTDNEVARRDFDVGPLDIAGVLPLSPEILRRCEELAKWHDTSLNWDYPPDPGPWRQAECDRFNAASHELLEAIRIELGADFEIIDRQPLIVEDPDLDVYLADPMGFRRT